MSRTGEPPEQRPGEMSDLRLLLASVCLFFCLLLFLGQCIIINGKLTQTLAVCMGPDSGSWWWDSIIISPGNDWAHFASFNWTQLTFWIMMTDHQL